MTKFQEGRYAVRVTCMKLGKSPAKGTPHVAVYFVPLHRLGDDENFPCPDEERAIYCYLTDKTIDRTAKDMAYIGYREPLEHLDDTHQEYSNGAGLEFEAECKYEDYQGKQYEKWELGNGKKAASVPLGQTELAMLKSQFSERFKDGMRETVRNDEYSRPILSPEQIAAESNAEDVPF